MTTTEIARAFLVPEPTIAQRIVRAKRTLAEAKVRFEVPRGEELAQRLPSVLEVVYLIFNEGYSASAGLDWMRPEMAEEALRLGRILAGLAPSEPEVHGLVALMEIQASRFGARTGPDGEPILLLEQNRGRWDQLLIRRGLTALGRSEALRTSLAARPAPTCCKPRSPHATRGHARGRTDWPRIAGLYATLAVVPSPIIGSTAPSPCRWRPARRRGLALVDTLASEPALEKYHLLPSVRGDLLTKLGRPRRGAGGILRAAAMTENARERDLLLKRAAEAAAGS